MNINRTLFFRIALASLALLLSAGFTSCGKDNETVDLTAVVADHPSSGDAKVFINGSYACWHNGDVVNINGTDYTVDVSSQSSNTAVIHNVNEAESYTAVYPYSSTGQSCSLGSTAVITPIAATQLYIEAATASSGGTNQQCIQAPLVAYSTGSQLNFHTPTALLKVVVSNSYTTERILSLHSIEITSDKADLAGSASITASTGSATFGSLTANQSKSVTLQFNKANASATDVIMEKGDNEAFYIAIAPVSTASTISVCVQAEDGSGKKYTFHSASANELTIGQGKMGTITIDMSQDNATEAAWFWGTGSENCPYLIENESDLKRLSELVSDATYNDNGKCFLQTDVITVSDEDWGTSTHPAVGTTANAFVANYDGGGHTVTLGVKTVESGYPVGVFGVVGNGAKISNLTVAGSIDLGNAYGDIDAGGVAGKVCGSATFESCTNQATVTSTYTTDATYGVGGICGTVDATDCTVTFTSCTNSAQVKAYGLKNGGIVGLSKNGTMNFTTCTNDGEIVSYDGSSDYYDHCGGIIGMVNSSNGTVTMTSCVNNGAITGNGSIGGFIGQIDRACEITGTSSNNGDITGSGASVAGIIGSVQKNATITIHGTRTTNNNPVIGGYNVAGIIGFTNGKTSLSYCCNNGEIEATTYSNNDYGVAGILARMNASGYRLMINYCKNTKRIYCSAKGIRFSLGGIVGYFNGGDYNTEATGSRIFNCYNIGKIEGDEKFLGGIVGFMKPADVANCYNVGDIEGSISGCGCGIIGRSNCMSTGKIHINNCYNKATINITGTSYPIAKHNCGNSYIINCYKFTGSREGISFSDGKVRSCGLVTISDATTSLTYYDNTFSTSYSYIVPAEFRSEANNNTIYSGTPQCNSLNSALSAWCTKNSSYAPDGGWSTWSDDPIPTFDW